LPGVVVRRPHAQGIATDAADLERLEVRGCAVLIHTGWDTYWRSDAYAVEHPFLTAAAANWLAEHGAALVGIDSYNIDDTRPRTRPVHTRLLGAEIPICEHMRGLEQLPDRGFRFCAVPPKVSGMGTFPVRAYAVVDA
jgi:kynurenine formamidase